MTTGTSTTYRAAAALSFELLQEQLGSYAIYGGRNLGQGFWHAANTLDTCIDYLLLAQPQPANTIVADGLAFFQATRDQDPDPSRWKMWRDDYGWWGRSLLKAYRNANALGITNPAPYLAAAELAWKGLRTAWDRADGGCWNNPLGPPGDPLRQRNSVTNELFWLLSTELARVTGQPAYKEWAANESTWFGSLATARTLYSAQGLVLECPTGDQYADGWVWSGDQGLFARANMSAGGQPTAVNLVATVFKVLCDANGVLADQSIGLNQDVDFATGKGVFCRNARDISPVATKIVLGSAAAAWNNRPGASAQFGYDWRGRDEPPADGPLWSITLQTSGQDALNAALAADPGGSIP